MTLNQAKTPIILNNNEQFSNLSKKYLELREEVKKIIDGNSIDSNILLTSSNNLSVIPISKKYTYLEQLPKNVVIDKIPDDDKTVNYIIINRQANCFTNRTVISFHGSENIVFIGDGSKIGNGEIRFYNSNGLVVLNDNNQHPNWFKVWLHSPSSWVYWGKNATSNGVICVTDNSKGIFVDDDCMFASNTWIRCSDMHDIFDIHSSETINDSADVLIESHVWVAQESLILKGAKIGAGSIIAARSLVTGEIPKFTLAMGSPAKIVKNNVSWYRNKLKPVRESTRLFVENQLNT